MVLNITRRALGALTLGGVAALATPALADNFPERPITMIIMSAEGGGMDRSSRLIGDAMAERLGQPMRYVNRPGASGEIALRTFLDTEGNGYTLFSGNLPTLMLGYGAKEQDYIFDEKVAWLGCYLDDPAVIATSASSPYMSAADLIEDAKSRRIRVGVANWSSVQTLALLHLGRDTGADFEIIPYSGFSNAATAMLGNHIEAAVGNFSAIENLGDSAKGLGIFAPESPGGTYTPLAETLGVPIFEASSNRALAVHKSLKSSYPERYITLLQTYQETVSDPSFVESFETIGASPTQYIEWDETRCDKAGSDILNGLSEFPELFNQ